LGRPKTPITNFNVQKMQERVKIKRLNGRAVEKTIAYRKRRLRQPIYIKKDK